MIYHENVARLGMRLGAEFLAAPRRAVVFAKDGQGGDASHAAHWVWQAPDMQTP